MTATVITKTLNKINRLPEQYSIGFKRLTSLPIRVRNNINLICVMNGETNNNSMKDFFQKLTDEEFINWMKVA